MDMVLLTPDEITRFISILRSRYNAAPAGGKKRSFRVRSS